MRRRSFKPVAAGPGGASCQIDLDDIYDLENDMSPKHQQKLHERYPQLSSRKLETDPDIDPRGNFIERNKLDIRNEYEITSRKP